MSSIQDSIANASCILCRQKGYGCKCGGAAGEMTPEAARVFWKQMPQRTEARRAQDKKEIEERGWKQTVRFEHQQCDWCKGKGVPSHRPKNCRDRNNRASRFYEAPSAEQELEVRKEKEEKRFLFAGGMFGEPEKFELDFVNGFMGSEARRAPATPFRFEPAEPLVSAFPPGGCRPMTKLF